jgi:uncharacterized OsmC-like protein/pimeloyl-ACP methyl ester carboxylesterase
MRHETLRVPNADGRALAARIDRPDGAALGVALFAHCFTCSKSSLAATRVSAALVECGFMVARFDFTGIGDSDGELTDSDFSANVEDLLIMADALRARGTPPNLLVGHSLGGAAVLVAARGIEEVRAVATLGAPCHPAHVKRLFTEDLSRIERDGEAMVNIGGRTFPVSASFLRDLDEHSMDEAIAGLGRPLLILHAPGDDVVGIDAARHIFDKAAYPKSFISLDDADHLLTRAADAAYVASVLSAWSSRYLAVEAEGAARPLEEERGADVYVREVQGGGFEQKIVAGGHQLVADEPESIGGKDRGPSPYQLLLSGLGACTTMTVRMYAERKGWPLTGVSVRLRHEKVAAADAPFAEPSQRKVDHVTRELFLEGALDPEQRDRLLEIAERCPVHRTLHEPVWVETALAKERS